MTLSPKVWGDALRRLQDEIPDFAFDAWIAPLAVRIVPDGCAADSDRISVGVGVAEDSSEAPDTANVSVAVTGRHGSDHVDDRGDHRSNRHVILGCPTSFHRDRVRVNYGDLIRDCWNSACDADEFGASVGKRSTTTIEFLTMKEFVSARGTAIEVRLPERREAAGRNTMRKVASGAMANKTIAAMAGVHIAAGSAAGTPGHPTVSGQARSAQFPERSKHLLAGGRNRLDSIRSVDRRSGEQGHDQQKDSRKGPGADSRTGPRQSPRRGFRDREPGSTQPELPFSFESFVVGPCNALAREATLALARRRQQSLNQLYLAGGSGMGKTHLARAAAAEARFHTHHYGEDANRSWSAQFGESSRPMSPSARREQAPRVIYTSADQFTSEFVSAMRRGQPEEWKRRYRGPIGLLIVEDVQFFSGRSKTQLELFHTVQHVLDAGGSVLLTGDRAPRDLVGLDERMRAQVGRGFVAELELPDALVRRHILRAKASGGGVHLPTDCLDLLVESTAGSVRDVESMLIQVVTTSSLLGRKIDLDLVREAVALKAGDSGAIESKRVATEEIVRIVASFFGKPAEALAGRSRRRDVLIPRQLSMYLAHRYTDASFTEIGRCLGRDHPSVRNAITRVERLILENAPLRYQVESLSERIDRAVKEL